MLARSRAFRRLQLQVELLETRLTPAGPLVLVPLNPSMDQFGRQIVTVQAYGDPNHAVFSVFDTGSSAITFCVNDRATLAAAGVPIPVLNPGGALADGVGGLINGDVSMPGTIIADGLHAASMSFTPQGTPIFTLTLGPSSGATPGIQSFLATSTGSPLLPTLTGTPILEPSTINPQGLAGDVLLQGSSLNFSPVIPGLTVSMPDLSFVSPSTQLSAGNGITGPVRIPMSFFGEDNYIYPGSQITSSPNLVQPDIQIMSGGTLISGQRFLFDTGAQLTVISTTEALALGLNLSQPTSSITIGGVGGSVVVPGYTLDELDVPTDSGVLQFTNVPVYVYDIAPGLDGLLGMNLFNNAHEMLFNPYDPAGPSVSLTFNGSPETPLSPGDLGLLQPLNLPFYPSLGGDNIPGLTAPGSDDGALTVTATDIQATEGAPFGGVVGSFTDSDPLAQHFTASINWGDGQTSFGMMNANNQGGFNVTGNHVYAEEGKYAVTITVKDSKGRLDSDTSNAQVADAAITVGSVPVVAVEGRSFSGKVGSITDANPMGAATDFTATIDWGDGQSSAGVVTSTGGFGFAINGTHSYLEEGPFTIKVTATDDGGSSGSSSQAITVSDAPITVGVVPVTGVVEGTSFNGIVGHFTDADPNGAVADYTATIYWGDGTNSAGTISANPKGGFDVSGGHSYALMGTYNYGVEVKDIGGAANGDGGTLAVYDAPLSGSGQNSSASQGGSTGPTLVATFTDAGGLQGPAHYSTTINWGDGSSSAGTISQPGGSGTPFNVTGSHTYQSAGTWTVTTAVTEIGGGTIDIVSHVKVFARDSILGRAGNSGQIWVGLSNGSSGFSTNVWANWNPNIAWQDVHTGDFDGDGRADIIARDPATGKWWVGLSNGTSFTASVWAAWNPHITWTDIQVADLTGDGKADLIGRVQQSGQWWAAISTGSSFTTSLWATWNPNVTWVDVQVGDFTGDGQADIAGRVLQSGQWWVGQSTGSSLKSSLWTTWNPAMTWVDVRSGDFAGDGKADLVGRVLQSGQWWVAQSTGSSFLNGLWAQWNPNVTWVDVQVGDFNSDGKADIIGRVKESGQWWLGTSNGSGFASSLWATWNPNVNWVDVQVGDFNGDGMSDITGRVLGSGQWWTSLGGGATSASTGLWATWSSAVVWNNVRCGDFA
jgi:Aspartyl protease/FG-GAP-like repeat